jgi:ABC-2 type transport system permease protein
LIIAIIRKELLAVLRDGRLLVLAFSVFAVLTGFFLASVAEHRQIQLEKQAVGATAKEQWDTQGVKNPHSAAHFGIYVFKPDSPLASVDPGLRQYIGQSLWLEPHKRNGARFSPAADQGLATRFGQASAGFVLYALLPLLVIALAFNAVTQEREQGTLRMLHSLGLSATKLLLGKFTGLLLAFTLVPKLQLGNPGNEALASRDWKLELGN